jgi:hypothetical protein
VRFVSLALTFSFGWLIDSSVPVLSLSWVSAVTAGHTKRVTVNAIMLSAYCIGNAAGPFIWQAKYKPRNHIPWLIIGICYVSCMATMLIIRYLLARENKRRDAEPKDPSQDEDVYIERVTDEGIVEKVKVDKVCSLFKFWHSGTLGLIYRAPILRNSWT